ncbi:MAG: protein kinase [Cyanobacteria bacterium P01_F01_bin.143]
MLNQLLGGHYRVVQDLEEGGLAKTYIVEDQHRPGHPKCAVKFLKPVSNRPNFLPTARRLFKQEAEILEKLGEHNQIPRLLAYFEENQKFYLVQEFIEGHTLGLELPRNHRWSERKVIEMLKDVLQTLEFVHSYGVIHRDIKPNNLIRRQQDGRLVLIDFGAVKKVCAPLITNQHDHSSLIHNTIAIGTQGYMPTEQVRGKPRLNSDIYALGMIGIQALTGLHPLNFDEDEEGELIWQDLAKVSPELANILSKMVRYHFKDRYQSTRDVLEALQPLVEQHSLVQPNSEKVSSSVESEPKRREQKKDSDIKTLIPAIAEVITKISPKTTKIESKIKQLTSALELKTKIQKTKFNALIPVAKLKSHNLISLTKSQMILGTGIMSAAIGIVTGYQYMNNLHLQAEQALAHIEKLQAQEKYQECWQEALVFSEYHSYLQAIAANLREQCSQSQAQVQLAQAEKLAAQSRLKDAIALAAHIPQDTDIYAEAQQLVAQWSEQIFQIASNKYQEGNLQEAIAIAKSVPANHPVAKQVATTIPHWQKTWQQNQTHLQTAQQKLAQRRWQEAINAAQQLSNTDYWQKQSQPIIRRAKAEIIAAQNAAQQAAQVTTAQQKQFSNRQVVNRSSSRNNSRPINISRPVISRPIKRAKSIKRSGSSPSFTSKMTCKYRGDHPKCPK